MQPASSPGRCRPRALLTLLGQPVEDWAQIKAWSEDAFLQGAATDEQRQRFDTANDGLWAYSRDMVADRQRAPRDPEHDMVSALLATEADGQSLDPDLIAGVVRLLLAAGHRLHDLRDGDRAALPGPHPQRIRPACEPSPT